MPPQKSGEAPRRRGPAFKPPRPVQAPAAAAAKRAPAASNATASRAAAIPSRNVSNKQTNITPSLALISDSEEEEGDDVEDALSQSDRDDELMEDAEEVAPPSPVAQPSVAPIPEQLLARLLLEGFEDKQMTIKKGAMDLYQEYMKIFVREAIARAQEENSDKRAPGNRHIDGFLQIEDLEHLAPQLLLDF